MMVPLEFVTALGIAVTELISNSYRHAFPDHEGAITVTLARSDNASTATLTIQVHAPSLRQVPVLDLNSGRAFSEFWWPPAAPSVCLSPGAS